MVWKGCANGEKGKMMKMTEALLDGDLIKCMFGIDIFVVNLSPVIETVPQVCLNIDVWEVFESSKFLNGLPSQFNMVISNVPYGVLILTIPASWAST
jgi:hypothetical protein